MNYSDRFHYGITVLDDGVTVRKTANVSRDVTYIFIETLINHFIRNPDPLVVPVYNFEFISHKGGMYSYSYDMMRLSMLSITEKKLIDRIGDLYDSHVAKACFLKYEEYPGADEYPELFRFLTEVTTGGKYWDIHSGNIMMDPDGNYRLIDLEGFLKTPLELEVNDWISRGNEDD